MGKNRPPKKVRDLLVELENSRRKLTGQKNADTVERIEQLIACKPDSYDVFENEVQLVLAQVAELLQSSVCPSTNSEVSEQLLPSDTTTDDTIFKHSPCTEKENENDNDERDDTWKAVCEVRAAMHADLRNEASQHIAGRGNWRSNRHWTRQHDVEWKSFVADETNISSRCIRKVPIEPSISLQFADKAAAGRKACAPPTRSAGSLVKKPVPTENAGSATVVLWIRPFDLRLHDNPALNYAASLRRPVHLVFAWSEEEDAALGKWRIGGSAASLWLYHALAALDSSYQKWYGLTINFVVGKTVAGALSHVVGNINADTVVTSRAYDISGRRSEQDLKQSLAADGVKLVCFNSFLLNDVEHIRLDMKERRGCFGTLVPFLFACNTQPMPPKPEDIPSTLLKSHLDELPSNIGLEGLGLCRFPVRADGSVLDWGATIMKEWNVTEEGALAALRQFLRPGGGLSRYEAERHLADASAVARISPYLRFGMLSCRTMYWESVAANAKEVSTTFWRRLVWRDLAYWQLLLFPDMADEPIRAHYAGQQWNTNEDAHHRWCRGKTGYPIVDAGMRELWETGWMAQNARMVCAIFLVEFLNISWVKGAHWFHHTLVDADPAINPMMWQNAGKSGLDQWNFTMHPAEFGRRMDPTGEYVRRWCPELRSLPARFIHCPWEAPERLQKHIPQGVYPDRQVNDLDAAAWVSRTAIRDQRAHRRDRNDDAGYDLIVLPKGSTIEHDGRLARLFTKKDYRLPLRAEMYDERPARSTLSHTQGPHAQAPYHGATSSKGRGKNMSSR